jgi:hypothetical protein
MKFLAFLTLTLLITSLQASALVTGTYSGVDGKKNKYKLHLREYPGRETSFIALLETSGAARAYIVDEFAHGKYGMLSLRTSDNYVIGATSSTPTLALNATPDLITIVPNQSPDLKIASSITIKTKSHKDLEWVDLLAGKYEDKSSLSALDINGEASFTNKSKDKSLTAGDYVLRESRPGLYLVLKSRLTSTGIHLDKSSNQIVYFIKESGFFSREGMVVLDNDGAIGIISKK